MATKHKRATMTARQLAEDYLAHQITRDVTRTSTRHHLNQLLALFGQRMEVAAAIAAYKKEHGLPVLDGKRELAGPPGGGGSSTGVSGGPENTRRHGHHSAPPRPPVAYRLGLGSGDGPPARVASGGFPAAPPQGTAHRSAHAGRGCAHV